MIKVNRDKIDKPKFFYSKEYDRLRQEINDFYGMHKNSRAQRTFSVDHFPYEVINLMMELFDYKCAFCESKLRETKMGYEGYVHRFRPSSYSQGFDSKEVAQDHYWWLTYEWENLYACCHSCSRFKSNLFPVEGKRAPLQTSHGQISSAEKAFLIDPCVDDPSLFFEFNISSCEIVPTNDQKLSFFSKIKELDFKAAHNKQKAEATIKILGLNRQDLIYERQQIIKELNAAIEAMRRGTDKTHSTAEKWNDVLKGTSKENHIAFRKALINDYLKDKKIQSLLGPLMDQIDAYTKQQEQFESIKQQEPLEEIKGGFDFNDFSPRSVGNDPYTEEAVLPSIEEEAEDIFDGILKNVYLDRIVLKNFKCFSDLTLKLPDYSEDTSSEPWLVFLGENGVGKSSVLKAIVLALMGQKYLNTLNLEVKNLLKYGKRSGFIQVYGKGKGEFYEITYNKKENKIVSNIHHPAAFLIGYGSTRLLPIGNLQPEENHPDYIKVKNLFDASVSLSNAKDWFLNTDRKTFNEVSRSLKNLLLLDNKDDIKRSIVNKQIFIKYHHSKETVDIDHLSDGYKSVFAIAIDMIYTLSKENTIYGLAEGIVLIDEIGTHLHPRWKMEIVKRLRTTFPKIQFIITTHEPLCLRGIIDNEVVVLRKNEENTIDAITDLPSPSSLRIDQLLTSKFFGLNSTMDIETELLFKKYYKLLALDESERSTDYEEQLQKLKNEVHELKYMRFGNDAREEIVYQVVDELLAKNMRDNNLKIDTQKIKKETVSRVKALWKKLDQKNKL
ncbi:AAA family ATPase [Kordia sp.]|uniref:AAA family ATPase n=1 Tax=Kordia sp. TaxID=1965332 RepID=UPI003D282399